MQKKTFQKSWLTPKPGLLLPNVDVKLGHPIGVHEKMIELLLERLEGTEHSDKGRFPRFVSRTRKQ